MDDDVVLRAITIGASIFITLATVTAIMMYYNTAKMSVAKVGTGTNLEEKYREDIKTLLYKEQVTGSELKNILEYFFQNQQVEIFIDKYYAYHQNGSQITIIPIGLKEKINFSKSDTYMNIMKTMMPNQKFSILITGNKYTFTLLT